MLSPKKNRKKWVSTLEIFFTVTSFLILGFSVLIGVLAPGLLYIKFFFKYVENYTNYDLAVFLEVFIILFSILPICFLLNKIINRLNQTNRLRLYIYIGLYNRFFEFGAIKQFKEYKINRSRNYSLKQSQLRFHCRRWAKGEELENKKSPECVSLFDN
jgi:hypothetical protein